MLQRCYKSWFTAGSHISYQTTFVTLFRLGLSAKKRQVMVSAYTVGVPWSHTGIPVPVGDSFPVILVTTLVYARIQISHSLLPVCVWAREQTPS